MKPEGSLLCMQEPAQGPVYHFITSWF